MVTISNCLWFDGNAQEAVEFWTSLVEGSAIGDVSYYPEGAQLPEGTVLMMTFTLAGEHFSALNGGPQYRFSPAHSIQLNAPDQAAADRYWDALTAEGGEEGQCGWCTDRFGMSWQVIPAGLGELLGDPDPVRAARANEALMVMKRIDIEALRRAADGE
ncbi:Glyoxalase superfamily enzyme, possibly 3-demethylubiquinone-9 3-methyltransferase [Raineyella antarctica]|uniref:Glyoxalase superfamily enzyme, possibly 3-demethylubiquinone-9 3-methyltransferase n=1 Tax=Raineyella antarctica TaxID=1577474 RepID=A0A1G6H748_9ACTN|nr:VOC family protein [Raineyella antarctica]SDB89928.1 Glyoxalase superfamily enzyme, possibly 3-demethylubiquinone-9 3-methyltransferase [Raineyella antarctica]